MRDEMTRLEAWRAIAQAPVIKGRPEPEPEKPSRLARFLARLTADHEKQPA